MTAPEALAWLFFGLWLGMTGLFLILAAGYDDALTRLRHARGQAAANLAWVQALCEELAAQPVPLDVVSLDDLDAAESIADCGWDR